MREPDSIPEFLKIELGKALAHADDKRVIELVEINNIDSNGFLDSDKSQTLLHEAVNPLSEFHSSQNQINIIDYLIAKEANPNLKNASGFSPLHIALEYHSLAKVALTLILSDKVDIDSVEKNGNNLVFTAIREYGKTWREEQRDVNKLRLEIVEELLRRGASLDKLNNHGISSRRWLQVYSDEKLHKLIEQYE